MQSFLDYPVPEIDWQVAGKRNGISAPPVPNHQGNETIQSAGAWEPTIQKIVAFQHLGENWDGLAAAPPDHGVLASAIGLAYIFHEREVEPPHRVVPGLEGSVIFEWQFPDGLYCEVEIVRPFAADVMMIEPGKPAKHWPLPTE
jgi:hypothetical protein